MNEEKRKVLDYLQEVNAAINIRQILIDLNIDKSLFYSCRCSLDKMKEVEKELKRRMKSLL